MEYVGSNVNDSNMRVCVSVNPILNGRTHLVFSHHLQRRAVVETDTNKKCIQEKGQGWATHHQKTTICMYMGSKSSFLMS